MARTIVARQATAKIRARSGEAFRTRKARMPNPTQTANHIPASSWATTERTPTVRRIRNDAIARRLADRIRSVNEGGRSLR
jgi:hypothetical protein